MCNNSDIYQMKRLERSCAYTPLPHAPPPHHDLHTVICAHGHSPGAVPPPQKRYKSVHYSGVDFAAAGSATEQLGEPPAEAKGTAGLAEEQRQQERLQRQQHDNRYSHRVCTSLLCTTVAVYRFNCPWTFNSLLRKIVDV